MSKQALTPTVRSNSNVGWAWEREMLGGGRRETRRTLAASPTAAVSGTGMVFPNSLMRPSPALPSPISSSLPLGFPSLWKLLVACRVRSRPFFFVGAMEQPSFTAPSPQLRTQETTRRRRRSVCTPGPGIRFYLSGVWMDGSVGDRWMDRSG
jgi:hypothetical protein